MDGAPSMSMSLTAQRSCRSLLRHRGEELRVKSAQGAGQRHSWEERGGVIVKNHRRRAAGRELLGGSCWVGAAGVVSPRQDTACPQGVAAVRVGEGAGRGRGGWLKPQAQVVASWGGRVPGPASPDGTLLPPGLWASVALCRSRRRCLVTF